MLILKEFEYIEEKEYEQVEETTLSEVQKTALKANVVFNFIDQNRHGILSTQKSKKDLLEIGNPYEICFAAFYLLNYKDDDYVWLIELCGIVVEMACEMLPWYLRPDFSSQQEIEYLYTPVSTLNAVYYRLWNGTTDDESDVSIIKDTICKLCIGRSYVLPQNNALLRRFMFMRKGTVEFIMELGLLIFTIPLFVLILLILHELYKQLAVPVSIAITVILLIILDHRKELHSFNITLLERIFRKFLIRRITRIPEIGFPKSKEKIRSEEDYEKEIDELSRSIAEQKNELARYKSQLHDAAKSIEEYKKQFDSIKAKYDANILELAELREAIYNIQTAR